MKTFNLQDAIAGKPVVTHGFSDAEFVAYSEDAVKSKSLVFKVYNQYAVFDEKGKGLYELFMKTEKKKIWINIYKDSDSYWYFSPEDAAAAIAHDDGYITTVESEIEV